MTTMARFVPFRTPLDSVAILQNRLNNIFNEFAIGSDSVQDQSLAAGSFVPPVDIYEDSQKLMLRLEVPGIPQDVLQIQLENQTLTVSGERKIAHEDNDATFHRLERRYGSFTRSFALPSFIDVDTAQAKYEDGVLSISLQKKEAAKPKQVAIQIEPASASLPKQMERSRTA